MTFGVFGHNFMLSRGAVRNGKAVTEFTGAASHFRAQHPVVIIKIYHSVGIKTLTVNR